MDPRHPEQAIARMDELTVQYKNTLKQLQGATVGSQLRELELKGGLIVQEICLVAPRLHEAMTQVSRQRRHDLAKGISVEPQDTLVKEAVEYLRTAEFAEAPVCRMPEETAKKIIETVETSVTPNQAETVIVEPKPKKKTTKKKAKK